MSWVCIGAIYDLYQNDYLVMFDNGVVGSIWNDELEPLEEL